MGKHRSKLNILANVLAVVRDNNGAKKTQIMYQAYLSYSLLVRYLNAVMEAGFVKCTEKNYYILTSRGKIFLNKFSEYKKSGQIIKDQLKSMEVQRSLLENMCNNNFLGMKK
jgi:predicted transcriptional regulator